jgi:5-methylcytosine-specific restriction endonuclease McrA
MIMLPFKHPRLRLDSELYRLLRQAVLKRDNWRCQLCGSTVGLEVHHIQPRSRLGDDAEGNLITLCSGCHQEVHLKTQRSRS